MTLKVWIPRGIVEEFLVNVPAGGRKTLRAYPYKWFSVEIYNDGPNSVKVRINAQSKPNAITLRSNAAKTFEFEKPNVEQIIFETESGETAAVTVTTMR